MKLKMKNPRPSYDTLNLNLNNMAIQNAELTWRLENPEVTVDESLNTFFIHYELREGNAVLNLDWCILENVTQQQAIDYIRDVILFPVGATEWDIESVCDLFGGMTFKTYNPIRTITVTVGSVPVYKFGGEK